MDIYVRYLKRITSNLVFRKNAHYFPMCKMGRKATRYIAAQTRVANSRVRSPRIGTSNAIGLVRYAEIFYLTFSKISYIIFMKGEKVWI